MVLTKDLDKCNITINRLKKYMRENPLVPLNVKDLGQLSVAYDGLWDKKYRKMLDLLADLELHANKKHKTIISPLLVQLKKELVAICIEVGDIIDRNLLCRAVGNRERALIYKFKGDYCRNKWRINSDSKYCREASKAYMYALIICKWNFVPSDTCLLQITLPYAEHLNNTNNPDEAVVVLMEVIKNAREDIARNHRTNKPYVETVLKELNNILVCSRENSKLRLAKLIEQLDNRRGYPARR